MLSHWVAVTVNTEPKANVALDRAATQIAMSFVTSRTCNFGLTALEGHVQG